MNDGACDTGIRNLRLATGGAAFLVNLLNPAAHNRHHFRVGSALCPGKRGCDWRAGDLARQGHASLLRIRLEHLAASADSEAISAECNSKDADEAAGSGHADVIREFRSEEHTSELQSLMRISYAVFCLKKKKYTVKNVYSKK